ncbi:MAG: phosphoethanolamine--lipid A transferase [Moraxella sp.]|nr:phosphoethanolamine--lipid A transferase [Moraxella sp.]
MKIPSLPSMTSSRLLALVALYFTLIANIPFYKTVLSLYGNYDAFFFSIPILVFFILNAIFQLLAVPYLHKVIIPLLLIISSSIGYNALFYGVYFDKNMLDNVLLTSSTEASKLITVPYVLWIIVFGIVPAVLYIKTKVDYRVWYKEIAVRIGMVALLVLVFGGVAKLYYQDYASFFRNNKDTVHLIAPSNFIGAIIGKVKNDRQNNRPHETIGMDAVQAKLDGAKRRVLVLVAGETTRAQNWGLGDYARQTTPQLAAMGDEIINFGDVSSCGTSTAVSLPCMFSVMDFDGFNGAAATKQDNALDIAQRSGVDVLWLDNDTGCKEVCNRVPTEDLTGTNDPKFCRNGECLDDILLQDFGKRLDNNPDKDLIIVLHTMGSHGPTYSERYTEAFRKFTPTCDTAEIAKCSQEELVNTYDNGILYIDNFLTTIIKELKTRDTIDSALYYISDHGESLGENGIYLHSTPYAIAPEVQTKVPMVFWASQGMREKLDNQCLHSNANHAYSQDNYFHTVLGLMDIQTSVYNQDKDILAKCR